MLAGRCCRVNRSYDTAGYHRCQGTAVNTHGTASFGSTLLAWLERAPITVLYILR